MSDVTRLTAQLGAWRERHGSLAERLAAALAAVIERAGLMAGACRLSGGSPRRWT